jgi:DNA-binding XRE family transcriptional regulator
MKLREYMIQNDLADGRMASLVGIDRTSICRLRRELTRPDWNTMERLSVVTGWRVMPNDFLMPPAALRKKLPKVWPQGSEGDVSPEENPRRDGKAHDHAALLNLPIGVDRVLPADSPEPGVRGLYERDPVEK